MQSCRRGADWRVAYGRGLAREQRGSLAGRFFLCGLQANAATRQLNLTGGTKEFKPQPRADKSFRAQFFWRNANLCKLTCSQFQNVSRNNMFFFFLKTRNYCSSNIKSAKISPLVVPLPVLKEIIAGCPKPAQFLAAISTSYRLSGCSLARVSLWREPEMLLEVHSARGSPTWNRDKRVRSNGREPTPDSCRFAAASGPFCI